MGILMKYRDIVSSFFWIGVGFAFCIGSWNFGFSRMGTIGAGFFPFVAGSVLISLSLILLVSALSVKKEDETAGEKFLPQQDSLKRLLLALLALFAYVLVVKYLGFFFTTFLFMIFLLRFIEPQRWVVVLTTAILTSVTAHLVFSLWLKVQLPTGIWGI